MHGASTSKGPSRTSRILVRLAVIKRERAAFRGKYERSYARRGPMRRGAIQQIILISPVQNMCKKGGRLCYRRGRGSDYEPVARNINLASRELRLSRGSLFLHSFSLPRLYAWIARSLCTLSTCTRLSRGSVRADEADVEKDLAQFQGFVILYTKTLKGIRELLITSGLF